MVETKNRATPRIIQEEKLFMFTKQPAGKVQLKRKVRKHLCPKCHCSFVIIIHNCKIAAFIVQAILENVVNNYGLKLKKSLTLFVFSSSIRKM